MKSLSSAAVVVSLLAAFYASPVFAQSTVKVTVLAQETSTSSGPASPDLAPPPGPPRTPPTRPPRVPPSR